MRFFLLAAAVCGVVAASSVARAETPIPDYRFSDAPYSNPPPVYPAPRDGWPFRPRAYYDSELTGPAPFLHWPWLIAPSKWTFFGGGDAQYYCHSAVDRRGVQTTACETEDPRDFHDMR
ncbi:MAG TPA: hypothetical protein P5256_16200 [Beijerinckiaceae bacterium]|nr:hypothetical protein [Hyphomicrobiales bacterium]HRY04675.1 hypothetical protein [Beijerinckiaceae bacterium]